jgi:hypothetical protein
MPESVKTGRKWVERTRPRDRMSQSACVELTVRFGPVVWQRELSDVPVYARLTGPLLESEVGGVHDMLSRAILVNGKSAEFKDYSG